MRKFYVGHVYIKKTKNTMGAFIFRINIIKVTSSLINVTIHMHLFSIMSHNFDIIQTISIFFSTNNKNNVNISGDIKNKYYFIINLCLVSFLRFPVEEFHNRSSAIDEYLVGAFTIYHYELLYKFTIPFFNYLLKLTHKF